MAKLIDDIRAGKLKLLPPHWIYEVVKEKPEEIKKRHRLFVEQLDGVTVYEITNVSDHFWGGTDKEWFDPLEDFPCPRPGFTHFWMEWKRPQKVLSETGRQPDLSLFPTRNGVLGWVYDMDQPAVRAYTENCVGVRQRIWSHKDDAFEKNDYSMRKTTDRILGAEVVVQLTGYSEFNNTQLIGPMFHVWYWLDKEGNVIDVIQEIETYGDVRPLPGETTGYENLVYPAMMALSLTNIRNVRVINVDAPRKLSNRNQKRYGYPMVSWKTITLLPYVTRFREDQKREATGGSRPFQWLPGHYAHYGIVGPGGWLRGKLFGKVVGLFWIPEHATGDAGVGTIIKDYRVFAPSEKDLKSTDEKKALDVTEKRP